MKEYIFFVGSLKVLGYDFFCSFIGKIACFERLILMLCYTSFIERFSKYNLKHIILKQQSTNLVDKKKNAIKLTVNGHLVAGQNNFN